MIMNTRWAPHPIGGLNASQQQLETMNNKKIKLTKYTGVKSKQWKVLVPHKQEKIDSSEVFLTKVQSVYGLLKTFEWGYTIIMMIFWQAKSSVLFLLCSHPQRRQYHRWWSKRTGKPKRRRRTKKTWSLPRPRKLWKHSQAQTVSDTVHSACSFGAGMKNVSSLMISVWSTEVSLVWNFTVAYVLDSVHVTKCQTLHDAGSYGASPVWPFKKKIELDLIWGSQQQNKCIFSKV